MIAIILLLLAMLLPSLSGAREQARRVLCANNLRQWGVALQAYRDEHDDFLPTEGTHGTTAPFRRGTWYNELPAYLGAQAYKDVDGVNVAIKEFPNNHVWICPSKNLTDAFKSASGKNQYHYGMNQVLDGMGPAPHGSPDTPGFPDQDELDEEDAKLRHLRGAVYAKRPTTVFLFDIAANSPRGSPRDVAVEYWRNPQTGGRIAKFHGDFANILYLAGGVINCKTAELYSDRDNRRGNIVWDHPRLYWGYPPRQEAMGNRQ